MPTAARRWREESRPLKEDLRHRMTCWTTGLMTVLQRSTTSAIGRPSCGRAPSDEARTRVNLEEIGESRWAPPASSLGAYKNAVENQDQTSPREQQTFGANGEARGT